MSHMQNIPGYLVLGCGQFLDERRDPPLAGLAFLILVICLFIYYRFIYFYIYLLKILFRSPFSF